ncbi:MAG: hypothetical protein JWN47_549 [Frankiales bacterium]|nr:hypothetical protein [Frankiales bacterium]
MLWRKSGVTDPDQGSVSVPWPISTVTVDRSLISGAVTPVVADAGAPEQNMSPIGRTVSFTSVGEMTAMVVGVGAQAPYPLPNVMMSSAPGPPRAARNRPSVLATIGPRTDGRSTGLRIRPLIGRNEACSTDGSSAEPRVELPAWVQPATSNALTRTTPPLLA